MTEALSSSASDVALHRLRGKPLTEMGGGQLLARYGGMAGVNWDTAMQDTESYLTAKMRTIAWLQKQTKESLQGVDPMQAASQLANEAGMSGIMNPLQNYPKFQENLQKRELKAKQWEDPNVRQIREELTGLQLDLETITSSVVLKAFAPEIHKIAKSIGELKPDDVEKIVNSIQRLVNTLDELVTEAYKISQDKDTKEFFKEVGGAVSTTVEAVDGAVTSTIGWKTAIEGLLGLRLLMFFGSLLGVIGLGAGAGVTGAILSAAAAVGVLGLAFMDLQKTDGFLSKVREQLSIEYPEAANALSGIIDKTSYAIEDYVIGAQAAGNKVAEFAGWATNDDPNTNLIEKLHAAGKKYKFDSNAILKTYQESGVNPNVLLAQAYQESGFNPNLTSPKGARGFAQFMPNTARQYGVANSFDAEESAKAQARMMRDVLAKNKGDYRLALAAYNSGQGGADYLAGHPEYLENPVARIKGNAKHNSSYKVETAGYQKNILTMAGGQDTSLLNKKPDNAPQFTPHPLTIGSGEPPQNIYTDEQRKEDIRKGDYSRLTEAERNEEIRKDLGGTDYEYLAQKQREQSVDTWRPVIYKHGEQDIQKTLGGTRLVTPNPIPMPPQLPPAGVKTTNNQTSSNVTMSNVFNITGENPKATADAVGYKMSEFECFSNEPVNANNSGFKT